MPEFENYDLFPEGKDRAFTAEEVSRAFDRVSENVRRRQGIISELSTIPNTDLSATAADVRLLTRQILPLTNYPVVMGLLKSTNLLPDNFEVNAINLIRTDKVDATVLKGEKEEKYHMFERQLATDVVSTDGGYLTIVFRKRYSHTKGQPAQMQITVEQGSAFDEPSKVNFLQGLRDGIEKRLFAFRHRKELHTFWVGLSRALVNIPDVYSSGN